MRSRQRTCGGFRARLKCKQAIARIGCTGLHTVVDGSAWFTIAGSSVIGITNHHGSFYGTWKLGSHKPQQSLVYQIVWEKLEFVHLVYTKCIYLVYVTVTLYGETRMKYNKGRLHDAATRGHDHREQGVGRARGLADIAARATARRPGAARRLNLALPLQQETCLKK